MEKINDVGIRYYTNSSGSSAVIQFYDGMSQLIGYDRVELEFTNDSIYFHGSDEKGLRLNDNKIQLWSLADRCKDWIGTYPLRFDVQKSCYKISLVDKEDHIRESKLGERLGTKVNYTPHYGSHAARSWRDQLDDDGNLIVDSNKEEDPVEEEVTTKSTEIKNTEVLNPSSAEKAMLSVLLNKSISLLDSGRYEEARAAIVTIKSLLEL